MNRLLKEAEEEIQKGELEREKTRRTKVQKTT